jgi:hypothetical protein
MHASTYAYVTDRLIAMSMPIADDDPPAAAAAGGKAPSGQLAAQLPGAGGNSAVLPRPAFSAVRAALLAAHGASHFVVINASELPYAYGVWRAGRCRARARRAGAPGAALWVDCVRDLLHKQHAISSQFTTR